jgi:hypothetical protein
VLAHSEEQTKTNLYVLTVLSGRRHKRSNRQPGVVNLVVGAQAELQTKKHRIVNRAVGSHAEEQTNNRLDALTLI